MPELPSGTVTFLFTDIEGSTRRWEHQPEAMAAALARHDDLLRRAIEAAGGRVFKTVGDAVCAAFASAVDAVAAAVAAQRALAAESWGGLGGLAVRMALHSGAAEQRDADYFGPPLNRVARLLAAGHGGQILLSRAAHDLVSGALPPGLILRDLGQHRLKDLQDPERIFQLVAPDLPAEFPPLRTLDMLLHNLPAHPTPLIGREHELATGRDLLASADVRLLTLTGPGGAGKTRLALALASDLVADFADGVYFVPLAAITDPALVLPAIASVIGVRHTDGQPLRDLLREELRPRYLLLVLDNLEQVTAAAADVADLLAACPRLKVLATSRIPLRLRGERTLPLPPLALPEPPEGGTGSAEPAAVERIAAYEGVRLFVERAQAVKAGFALTPENAAAVIEVCRRLDGLPLAIELAAARVRLLPPKAMLRRLERRLDLLAGGAHDLPARQQTMRAAIAWSYDLLDRDEQRLFAALSIFVGGGSLEAAEAVAGRAVEESRSRGVEKHESTPRLLDSPFDLLASLADKSLVRIDEDEEDEPRVGMLETIREFGLECLAANGDAERVGRCHAEWFLALAEEAEPYLEGPEQARWLDRLDRDHANLRAALDWLREHGEPDLALRLGAALWRFWWLRGHFSEGRAQLDRLLVLSASPAAAAVRAKALNGAGVLADCQGDYEQATALHEESMGIAETLGDKAAMAWSLNNLGWVALHRGDYERAQELLERNLAIAREIGDKASVGTALIDLGNVAYSRMDHGQSLALSTEGLAIFRELGDESHVARALNQLGNLALADGDLDRAETLLTECLALHRNVADKQGVAGALNNLAEVARRRGDDARAMALYEESRALAEEIGDRLVVAIALENQAELAVGQGDHLRARELYCHGLALYRLMGDWLGVTASLAGLADVAAVRGRPEAGARLLGVAAALRAAHALPDPDAAADAEPTGTPSITGKIRSALGEEEFARAWAAGQAMPFQQAIDEALAPTP